MKAESLLVRSVRSNFEKYESGNHNLSISKLKRSRRERSNDGSHHYGPNLRGRVLGVMLSGHPLRGGTTFFFPRRGQNFLVICHTYHDMLYTCAVNQYPAPQARGENVSKHRKNGTHEMTLHVDVLAIPCLLYTSPSPRDLSTSRMPSSA